MLGLGLRLEDSRCWWEGSGGADGGAAAAGAAAGAGGRRPDGSGEYAREVLQTRRHGC